MKYDEKKLNAYWEKWDAIHALWRKNGWKGRGHDHGREFSYPCGHSVWAGFGLTDEQCKTCVRCKYSKSFED